MDSGPRKIYVFEKFLSTRKCLSSRKCLSIENCSSMEKCLSTGNSQITSKFVDHEARAGFTGRRGGCLTVQLEGRVKRERFCVILGECRLGSAESKMLPLVTCGKATYLSYDWLEPLSV